MNAYYYSPFYPTDNYVPEPVAETPPVQIEIADIDHKGKINGQKHTLQLGSYLRSKGQADACFNKIIKEMNLISFKV
jgi:hypothetical protein